MLEHKLLYPYHFYKTNFNGYIIHIFLYKYFVHGFHNLISHSFKTGLSLKFLNCSSEKFNLTKGFICLLKELSWMASMIQRR